MSSTSDAPRPSTPADDETVERENSAGETPDGLVDAEAAEQFNHDVEQRLRGQSLASPLPSGDGRETGVDEDSPVHLDNPE